MNVKTVQTAEVQDFLQLASGLKSAKGSTRAKQIVHRVMSDVFQAIEDLDITPDEFWSAVNYFNQLGASGEAGLLAAGLGFERYLDIRMDAADAAAGIDGGTPRTIEGPLYVAGAPISDGVARLDTDADEGQVLIMHGTVRDLAGKPLAGAIVDVWHANSKGMYSHFDASQSAFNLRRRIRTDAQGRYEFRSTVPCGYGCPPDGPTQALLDTIGRHGQRPAHIHFFVSADRHRHLTTQINIDGDAYLHDDFAFATRDDLIPAVAQITAAEAIKARGLDAAYADIAFDFTLTPLTDVVADQVVQRQRAAV
ncbi:MAG TPA: catechol 1,2-dioxygenase [Rhodanobacter sp.]|nr:catechol 1,2-dioxygenase [Rhodanobacter sp.]